MKAINVSRVSTEEQKEAGNSLPAQVERIDIYCKKKSFIMLKPFSFDESAYKDKRDEFDKLVEYVEQVIKKDKVAVANIKAIKTRKPNKLAIRPPAIAAILLAIS